MKSKSNETALVRSAVEWLNIVGVFAWRVNTGAAQYQDRHGKKRFVRFGAPGVSDIIGIMPDGRFLAAEAKVGDNTPTAAQRHFLDMVNAAGGLGVVFHSIDELAEAIGA